MFNLTLDKDSRKFWAAAKKNKLLIQRTINSNKFFLYSRGHSGAIAEDDYEWVEASGLGEIYSFTICNIPGASKYYLDKTPYVIAIINLQEKVRIMSNIIEKNHNNIKIGKKVQVIFQKLNEEITLPCFKLI
tara:strand:+ start:2922 stop:3317 length:396 start_codon:yes stop_codon:yes gene_type:complete